ncbi:MAG: hypothetical protein WC242_00165 [Candidatus Paceibacterota bacterium]|jgi:hypothetical protein
MRVTFLRQRKGIQMETVRGADSIGSYDVVRRIVELLESSATNLIRAGKDNLFLYSYDTVTDEPVCDVYHGFFDSDRRYLLIILLYQELDRRLRDKNLNGFEEGFVGVYMPGLLDNPEISIETKFKTVAAVLYGGARRRSDVERLMEKDWKDLIAAIRIAQSEGIGAVEVLNFIEQQPVAA